MLIYYRNLGYSEVGARFVSTMSAKSPSLHDMAWPLSANEIHYGFQFTVISVQLMYTSSFPVGSCSVLVTVNGSAVAAWCVVNDVIWHLAVTERHLHQSPVSTEPFMNVTQTLTCRVDRMFLSWNVDSASCILYSISILNLFRKKQEKIQPVPKVGGDQWALFPSPLKLGGGTSLEFHRVVAPMYWCQKLARVTYRTIAPGNKRQKSAFLFLTLATDARNRLVYNIALSKQKREVCYSTGTVSYTHLTLPTKRIV